MKLSITYAELQDYVANHFHKTDNLEYVDGTTVSVSVPIKVLGFTKSISINLIVKEIEGTDLFLWRKRSIPTHSEWLYPLTFDAGKGLKEA